MKQLSTLLLLFLFLSANAQNNQVLVSFDHKVGGTNLVINQTVFPIWNNKKVILTRAEFYISEVELKHADGTSVPLADQYLLVNAKEPQANFDLGMQPMGATHDLVLHLGVPEAVNHNDPAAWPSAHPLAPKDPSMHWGWSAGYRFMAIEGKVDNNGDDIPETDFEFHNLGDALYKTVTLTGAETAQNGVLHLHFALDYAKLFMNMTMTGNIIKHGSSALNIAMMDNAANEHFISMLGSTAVRDLEQASLLVQAAPNPADELLQLQFDFVGANGLQLELYNAQGSRVRQLTGLPASGLVNVETGNLPVGIYSAVFSQEGRLLARKQVVVQH